MNTSPLIPNTTFNNFPGSVAFLSSEMSINKATNTTANSNSFHSVELSIPINIVSNIAKHAILPFCHKQIANAENRKGKLFKFGEGLCKKQLKIKVLYKYLKELSSLTSIQAEQDINIVSQMHYIKCIKKGI